MYFTENYSQTYIFFRKKLYLPFVMYFEIQSEIAYLLSIKEIKRSLHVFAIPKVRIVDTLSLACSTFQMLIMEM